VIVGKYKTENDNFFASDDKICHKVPNKQPCTVFIFALNYLIYMKKQILTSIAASALIVFTACEKPLEKEIVNSVDQGLKTENLESVQQRESESGAYVVDLVNSVTNVNLKNPEVNAFILSTEYLGLPVNIKADIQWSAGLLITFKTNEELKALTFPISNSNMNLVVYMRVIDKQLTKKYLYSAALLKYRQVGERTVDYAMTSLNGDAFYSLQLTNDNIVSNFEVTNEMSFAKLTDDTGTPVKIPTCMEKTKTFKGCMACAFKECDADLTCSITCNIMVVPCVIGFAAACALF
jgi:hypothetical protein